MFPASTAIEVRSSFRPSAAVVADMCYAYAARGVNGDMLLLLLRIQRLRDSKQELSTPAVALAARLPSP